MARVACLTWQKDETLLLRPWLLHHGSICGFDNLFVFDNGSNDPQVLATLDEFAALGVQIDRSHAGEDDGERRGEIVGARIAQMRETHSHDLAIPLECEDFLMARSDAGIVTNPESIRAALEPIAAQRVTRLTERGLVNLPGCWDMFEMATVHKCFIPVHQFLGLANDLAGAILPPGQAYVDCAMIIASFRRRPLGQLQAWARERLQGLVDVDDAVALQNYLGPFRKLKEALLIGPETYYRMTIKSPPIRFRGLTQSIGAAMDIHALASAWESGRPAGEFAGRVPVIALDSIPFSASDYQAAHADVAHSGLAPLDHFLLHGFAEGRQARDSLEAAGELFERKLMLRDLDWDMPETYINLVDHLVKLDRGAEAELLLAQAMEKFPGNARLLCEYAQALEINGHPEQAAEIWRQTVAADANLRFAWIRLVCNLVELEKLDEAAHVRHQAEQQFVDGWEFIEQAVWIAQLRGNLAEAVRHMSRLLAMRPEERFQRALDYMMAALAAEEPARPVPESPPFAAMPAEKTAEVPQAGREATAPEPIKVKPRKRFWPF